MPDNEFDKLVKDKFEDAAIEPSANLWANIEKQLAPKRKRTIQIFWMAAAVICIAITAMLVFQKTEKIMLRGGEATAIVVKPTAQQEMVANDVDTAFALPVTTRLSEEISFASKKVKVVITPENKAPENNLRNIQAPVQPNTNEFRLAIKQQDPKPIDVLPVNETQADNTTVIAQLAPKQNMESDVISETDNISQRKGIRNVGDLVNFVVEKVDKREKKLVRFNTDDDDNSSIVGINIGFLKFNKKGK
jgi:hypothetical protein